MSPADANILAELATAYAAGVADDAERRQVETWLAAGDPATIGALAEARALLAAVSAAGATPLTPGDHQWDRLAARIVADSGQQTAATEPPPPVVLKMPPRRSPWPAVLTAAAAAALIGGGLSFLLATRGDAQRQRDFVALRQTVADQTDRLAAGDSIARQRQTELADRRLEVEQLRGRLDQQTARLDRQRDALARQELEIGRQRGELDARAAQVGEQQRRVAELAGQLEATQRQLDFVTAPGVQLAQMSGTKEMPAVIGRAFVGEGRAARVQLSVSQLAPPPAGKTYQFWVIPAGEGQAPVSIGVFPVGADGTARVDATLPATTAPPKVLAISLEPAGGTESPTGPIVATGPIGG